MQTRLPSASKVGRAFRCIASAVYPRTDRVRPSGERGTAVHKYLLEDVPRVGRDKALALVPPEWRAACEVIDLDKLPDPSTFAAEVAFAWDHETDKGREVGRNIGRNYGPLKSTEYPGTADLVGLFGPDGVCVLDVKSGRLPPEDEQLMTLALAAVRTYPGRKWARVGFVFVPEHGEPYSRQWDMDQVDLDAFADRLRDRAAEIARAREAYAKSIEPKATIGEHCRFCPCLAECRPSQLAVRAFVADPLTFESRIKLMTPEQKGKAWLVLDQVDRVAEEARRVLKLEAEQSPLPLPDGRLVQIGEGSRRDPDPDAVYQSLKAKFGPEVAEAAVPSKRGATLGGIAKAIGSKPGTAKAEALFAELEHEGALRRARWPEAKIVRPDPARKETG